MRGVIRFSEAASLALHAMAFLGAARHRRVLIDEMADALPVSKAHLAKVLQRLVKCGLVASTRGRNGGFQLVREPEEIALLEIYEAVEGPLEVSRCTSSDPQCDGECILGTSLGEAGALLREKLVRTRLSELEAGLGARARGRRSRTRAGRRAAAA